MIQLACIFDGGLCIALICGGGALMGAFGIKFGGKGKTKHPHDDCNKCPGPEDDYLERLQGEGMHTEESYLGVGSPFCKGCGHETRLNTQGDATWICDNCGTEML